MSEYAFGKRTTMENERLPTYEPIHDAHFVPRFRIFREGTVKGEFEPHPSARFYKTFQEAYTRALELLPKLGVLHIYMTVAVVAPEAPKHTLIMLDSELLRKQPALDAPPIAVFNGFRVGDVVAPVNGRKRGTVTDIGGGGSGVTVRWHRRTKDKNAVVELMAAHALRLIKRGK